MSQRVTTPLLILLVPSIDDFIISSKWEAYGLATVLLFWKVLMLKPQGQNNSRFQKHRIDSYRFLKALSHQRDMTQLLQSRLSVTAAYDQTRWSPGKHKQQRALSLCQGTAERLTLCTRGRAGLAAGKAEDINFTH